MTIDRFEESFSKSIRKTTQKLKSFDVTTFSKQCLLPLYIITTYLGLIHERSVVELHTRCSLLTVLYQPKQIKTEALLVMYPICHIRLSIIVKWYMVHGYEHVTHFNMFFSVLKSDIISGAAYKCAQNIEHLTRKRKTINGACQSVTLNMIECRVDDFASEDSFRPRAHANENKVKQTFTHTHKHTNEIS